MFTEYSKELRNYFFPRIKIKNSNETKNLFEFFESRKLYKINQKNINHENKKLTNIETDGGAKSITQKSYLFEKTSNSFTIKTLNVTINIYSKKNELDLSYKLSNILNYVYSLSDVYIKYLTIDIYLIDQKKKITSNKKDLDQEEINSGYCILGKTPHIVIYRSEELIKVFIHELIHAFQYDNYKDNDNIIKNNNKKYNLSCDNINTNEAYTEIWANLINCYLISKSGGRESYNLFLILIELEKHFSLFQAEKVIYLTNINGKTPINVNKYTNVLSYFIIRCELFKELNLFLKFCKTNNKNYITLKNENDFFSHLKKKQIIEKKNRRFNNINKKSYIFTTMRMSLNEISIYAETN